MACPMNYSGFARCEPALSDLLADPILQMLMAKDGVRSSDLEALIDGVRNTAGTMAPEIATALEIPTAPETATNRNCMDL